MNSLVGEKRYSFFNQIEKIYFYPYRKNIKNIHYHNKLNKKIIKKKINILRNLSNKDWSSYLNKVDKITYDKKNSILMKLINNELKNENSSSSTN